MNVPKISTIIPTHNRPELLRRAIDSVLRQSYVDLEIVVVDDGDVLAESVVKSIRDSRIRYIKHEYPHRGGSAARNTGIMASTGDFIAFLDDDDEWLAKKLEIQMGRFRNTSDDVGFCFSAVTNIKNACTENSVVPDGVGNYFERALTRFSGVLTVTLIVKRYVLNDVGYFDENFPSHQEADLVIRIAKKYKGLGVNEPLVRVNMAAHDSIGSSSERRILGREMILNKYKDEFAKRPEILAKHYFQLGLWFRDDEKYAKAKIYFGKALCLRFSFGFLFHYLSLAFGGRFYTSLVKRFK